MSAKLFIPSKIKIGFQKRDDTFTGKLAYVIYFDEKGVLRKEKSWTDWRDEKIAPVEYDNTPRSGYLFNKGVKRDGYYWGSGRSVIRVHDPRNFEFEISVDNLIGILMHSDVSKRDIVEECVFAWHGSDLVLLPVNSEDYQSSLVYTEKQSEKLSTKDLVKGHTYQQKKSDETYIYLGFFEWFDWDNKYGVIRTHKTTGKKKHVFYGKKSYGGSGFVTPGMATFSSVASTEVAENYATLVEDFFKTDNSQPIVGYKIIPFTKDTKTFAKETKPGTVNRISPLPWGDREIDFASAFHDRMVSTTNYTFADETTVVEVEKYRDTSSWNYTGPSPFLDAMITKAKELGFDISEDIKRRILHHLLNNPDLSNRHITIQQCKKLLLSEGYGEFCYVLKNGTIL